MQHKSLVLEREQDEVGKVDEVVLEAQEAQVDRVDRVVQVGKVRNYFHLHFLR
jgi:hypothetical protein